MTKSRKQKPAKRQDYTPVTVPFTATPTGETPGLGQWAHPTVWTDRMLATLLENKVRGGKWHTLIDKVYGEVNLYSSACKVLGKKGAAGVDRQTVVDFAQLQREELARLQQQLKEGSYCPSPVRRTWIDKPGSSEKRPLGIPTVRDRVVQTALVHVIEPILDHTFHERSFGFRHGRGCHHALECVEKLLNAGYVYVLGYSFRGNLRFPREKSHDKLQDRIRELTPRQSGVSLECTIQQLNRTLRGWFGYFRHCHPSVFTAIDSHLRARLRRLLMKRHRRNPQRLSRNWRWPNAFFAEHGLYSLGEAHARFAQSLRGNY